MKKTNSHKKKNLSLKSKLLWILGISTIFVVSSIYFAINYSAGPFAFLASPLGINAVKEKCNNDPACIELMVTAAESGIRVANTNGQMSAANFAASVQKQAKTKPKTKELEEVINQANQISAPDNSNSNNNDTNAQGNTNGQQSQNNSNTSCPGGNGVQLAAGNFVATGYGLKENGKTVCKSGEVCPKRQCVEILPGCSHAKTFVACDDADPKKLILPPGAGAEYTVGMTQSEYDKTTKDGANALLKAKGDLGGACVDKSGVNQPTGATQGETQCLKGDWVYKTEYQTAMAALCDPNTQNYIKEKDVCETKKEPPKSKTCDPENYCEADTAIKCTINSYGEKVLTSKPCTPFKCNQNTGFCESLQKEKRARESETYCPMLSGNPKLSSSSDCSKMVGSVLYAIENKVNKNGTKIGGEITSNPLDCIYGSTPYTADGKKLSNLSICNDYTRTPPKTMTNPSQLTTVLPDAGSSNANTTTNEVINSTTPTITQDGGQRVTDPSKCPNGSVAIPNSGGASICNNSDGTPYDVQRGYANAQQTQTTQPRTTSSKKIAGSSCSTYAGLSHDDSVCESNICIYRDSSNGQGRGGYFCADTTGNIPSTRVADFTPASLTECNNGLPSDQVCLRSAVDNNYFYRAYKSNISQVLKINNATSCGIFGGLLGDHSKCSSGQNCFIKQINGSNGWYCADSASFLKVAGTPCSMLGLAANNSSCQSGSCKYRSSSDGSGKSGYYCADSNGSIPSARVTEFTPSSLIDCNNGLPADQICIKSSLNSSDNGYYYRAYK